ncbi:MAG: hypothetical protein R3E31_06615 [Chloroflexota bacterium]
MTDIQDYQTIAMPSHKLQALDRLVGTWELSGDTTGIVTYRWMEGGFFLVQDIDIHLFGNHVKAVEYIGHLHPFGQEPSDDVYSRVYDTQGNTLDYVYELEGDVLTIWGGEKGSPAYFKGEFIDDDMNEGAWFFPGGGGYTTTMKRKKE